MLRRRGLLAGLGALLAAPAIIRTPGLLMPVRPLREPLWVGVDWASGPSTSVTWTAPASGVFEFKVHAVFDGKTVDITDMLPLRTGGNETWHSEPLNNQNDGTIPAQKRLLFGDWLVVDSKFRG